MKHKIYPPVGTEEDFFLEKIPGWPQYDFSYARLAFTAPMSYHLCVQVGSYSTGNYKDGIIAVWKIRHLK